jgi:predicted CXXCH cytochrome family protein
MVRQIFIRPSWLAIILIMIAIIIVAFDYKPAQESVIGKELQQKTEIKQTVSLTQFKNAKENENCLKCHGQSKYSYENPEQGKIVKKRMYTELIIQPDLFYTSNHRQFKCTDCHSEDYSTFPHPGNLRMESKASCIDCHGGDAQYAKFHFEAIDTAFQESVHATRHNEEFTCWMCHNPHAYKINARTNENIKETIIYDNTICLNCHSDYTRFQLLTDKKNPNLLQKHEWLPNQELHFESVRCVECHAEKKNDSTLVSHKILPKGQAVKKCKECHSSNSELMASLYKQQAQEIRSTKGFFKGVLTSESYVIGASRNYMLNIFSVIIFCCIVIGVGIHGILRTLKK